MTAYVQLTILCDWCGLPIVADHPGFERLLRPEDLPAAITKARADMERLVPITGTDRLYFRGRRWPSPPGMQLDLCRQCIQRGTPPKRLPPKTPRRRKPS